MHISFETLPRLEWGKEFNAPDDYSILDYAVGSREGYCEDREGVGRCWRLWESQYEGDQLSGPCSFKLAKPLQEYIKGLEPSEETIKRIEPFRVSISSGLIGRCPLHPVSGNIGL